MRSVRVSVYAVRGRRVTRRTVTGALAAVTLFAAAAGLSAQAMREVPVDVGARDPAISPDGSTIALSILGKIWTLPIAGGTATRVTDGPGWDTRPAWSPDGEFLAYASRSGNGSDIIVRNMETGGSRYLHHAPSSVGQMAYSPDGDRLYFVNDLSQYDAHVWWIPVGGGSPTQLTFTRNWHEWSFALAPDGERILVESGRYEGTDLWELTVDSMAATRVTETPIRKSSVVWSRDGRRRAYVESRNGVDRIMVLDGAAAPRAVHTSEFDQKQLAFAPDGSLLVVAGRRLYRLDESSGALAAIPFEARFRVAARPANDLVITNVRLFTATGDDLVDGATVVVRDGRIAAAGAGVAAPADIPLVIDGAGRTLLPGLMDNHYHYWAPLQGADLLASGVTSIRDPGSALADALDYKDAIRLGILPGPDDYTAGPLIDGTGGYHPMVDVSIDDPAAAAPLVRALKTAGVDLLKVYFLLDPPVLAAVVAEAKVQGLPVTGHIGVRTGWGEAMDAGISGFNHIRIWRDFLPPELQPDGRDESLDAGRNPIGRMQGDWSLIDPESPEVTALLRRMADTGTAMDPTLFIQGIGDEARQQFSIAEFATARETFEKMQAFVRRAVELGVTLLAGTDNVGLNNELEAYEEAGVPRAAILRAATVNGARWLGKDDFGTIEPGKRALLLLVDGNPLEDISTLRKVDLVVKNGTVVFRR